MTAAVPATPHPGFGAFGKEHREFFFALGPEGWTPVAGYQGVEEKILSGGLDIDRKMGCLTRLSRWAPGAKVDQPVVHAWCEEVMILSGSLSIGTPDATGEAAVVLPAGTYAVRPDGIAHGPFFSRDGCVMIEFAYFPPAFPAVRSA